MSYRESERYAQLIDECGLIEVEGGTRVIEVEYYPLYRRLCRFVNFMTAKCNLENLLTKRTREQLDRLVSRARLQIDVICLYGGPSKNPDLLRVGEELETLAKEVRPRSMKQSFKQLIAGLGAA